MIQACTALLRIDDAAGVELEDSLVCLNSNRDWTVSNGSLDCEGIVCFHLNMASRFHWGQLEIEIDTETILCCVRIEILTDDTLISHVVHGLVFISTVASKTVVIDPTAINQLLL